jgi:hypothetical protein
MRVGFSFPHSLYVRLPILQFEHITVAEGFREFLLVAHEEDALQPAYPGHPVLDPSCSARIATLPFFFIVAL